MSANKISVSKLADCGNRKVWLAGLLGVLFPGLGQLYNGQIVLSFVIIFLVFACHALIAIPKPNLPIPLILISVGIYILAIIHAVIKARKLRDGFVASRWNNWIFYMVVLMFGIILTQLPGQLLYSFHLVNNDCMQGVYDPGDVVYVNKIATLFSAPQEEDIVVFRPVNNPKTVSIGRIWALAGKQIEIHDNMIFMDGCRIITTGTNPFELPTVNRDSADIVRRENRQDILVPENNYLLIGDNSFGWADETCTGVIPRTNLVGRVDYTFYKNPGGEVVVRGNFRLLIYYLFFGL